MQQYVKLSQNEVDTRGPQAKLLDRLQQMASLPAALPDLLPLVRTEQVDGQEVQTIHEGKMTEAERAKIDTDTREMYKKMKLESVGTSDAQGREINFLRTPHRQVYDFLPPFLKKIALEIQQKERAGEDIVDGNFMVDQLMRYIVDQGVAREQNFGEKIATGEQILNRAAFSTHITKDRERRRQSLMEKKILGGEKYTQDGLDDEVDAMYTFRQIDIKDFRASDFAIDKEGNKGADYTMNKVVARVNKNILFINSMLKNHGIDATVATCRYGGDELCLGFMGLEDPMIRNLIFGVVTGLNETGNPELTFQNGVKAIEGYFNRAGEVKKEKVDLKAGLEEISVPKDKSKRKIFWEQFSIGLILSDDEISDIEESRKREPGVKLAVGLHEAPIIETHEEFVEYTEKLIKRHPELAEVAKVMLEYSGKMPEVMAEFPKFVQEIMYDRLLGEKVTGFQDCVDHMVRGDMKELYMFDMKGIKEFNDVQSLATGDQAIATLWNNIANSLGEDFDKVMCFRRGSTFIVGLRKDAEVKPESRKKLDNLTSIAFQGNQFDIGYHKVDVGEMKFARRQSEAKEGELDVRDVLEELIVDTHEAWNKRVIDAYLVENPDINGKRAIERMDRCLDVCGKMQEEASHSISTSKESKVAYGSEQYVKLGYTLKHKLFFEIFPHKLEEARTMGEQHKVDEIVGNWKRLLEKYFVLQNLTQYDIH